MRILMTTDVFSFRPAGGAGTVLYETARRLVRWGHTVHVVCRRREDLPEDGELEGIRFHTYRADEGAAWSLLASCWKETPRRARPAFAEGIDVVNAHHPLPLWILFPALRELRIPALYTYHSPWHEEYLGRRFPDPQARVPLPHRLGGFLRRMLEERVVLRADRLLFLSRYMRDHCAALHSVPRGGRVVVPGGVDLEAFRPPGDRRALRADLGLPQDRFLLFSVGYFIPRKGLAVLVEAFRRILGDFPDVDLVAGGAGPDWETVRRAVDGAGVGDRIHMPGFVPWERLADYYGAADLFVVPSQALEGFGLVVLEALACGTPVVATPVGGLVEAVGSFDRNLLFDGTSAEVIAGGLRRYLASPGRWARLRPACREHVERGFSWDRAARSLEGALSELVDRG